MVIIVFFAVPAAWHSKLRYMVQYRVSPSKVSVDKEPHDCDFWRAPVGEKDCHNGSVVSTVRMGLSADRRVHVVSYETARAGSRLRPRLGHRCHRTPRWKAWTSRGIRSMSEKPREALDDC